MDTRKEKEAAGTGVERREFLSGAATVAGASLLGASFRGSVCSTVP